MLIVYNFLLRYQFELSLYFLIGILLTMYFEWITMKYLSKGPWRNGDRIISIFLWFIPLVFFVIGLIQGIIRGPQKDEDNEEL